MRIIAVVNQKGGVGKTTTTINLSHALTLAGKKVLVVDLDPQAQLTAGFGINPFRQSGVDKILLDDTNIKDLVVNVRKNLFLLAAGPKLGNLEHSSKNVVKDGSALRNVLISCDHDYDYVLIDSPPSSGLFVINAVYAAQEVLTPVCSDYFSLHGVAHLFGTFKKLEVALGHKIQQWIVITRYHPRRRLAKEVMEKLQSHFPGRVMKTQIREVAALAEAPSVGKTIFEYKYNSVGSIDYHALAQDLIKKRTL